VLRADLERGLAALHQHPDESAIAQLVTFIELLSRWNRTYNLTAVRDPRAMVNRHLLDSLSVLPHVQGERILDVGSGAGLPGVPLAICCPARAFHLLDSNGKKMRFLFQVKTQLGLGNLTLVQGRAETLSDAQGFDTVLARAVGSLAELLRMAGHLLAVDGSLLAMKSELQPGELAAVPAPYTVDECIELQLPGADQRRQLVRIRRA
jgi:16S rRNA (guanine527-N7)-methyltransferase